MHDGDKTVSSLAFERMMLAKMSVQEENEEKEDYNIKGSCLYDLLKLETSTDWDKDWKNSMSSPRSRLESLQSEAGNGLCADCDSPDPKWISVNIGAFICIKCSGVHRSLGAHISKVLSQKLDEWTNEQVDALIELGGNNAVNMKYEANVPQDYAKPKPDSSAEQRSDFIRRKYDLKQFSNQEEQLYCPFPPPASSHNRSSSWGSHPPSHDKKRYEKQTTVTRIYGLGNPFRHSWRKNDHKLASKSMSMAGMVEFVGLVKVNVVKGTNLAIRDMVSSDPYVIISLGNQSVKTRVIKNNLNPIWNERLMLSIPESVPPLKLLVFDKDTFSTDDFMGDAEIDIQPLLSAAKAWESSAIREPMQLGKWKACKENNLVKDSDITLENGTVRQEVSIKLLNVECGILEVELECVPLTQ